LRSRLTGKEVPEVSYAKLLARRQEKAPVEVKRRAAVDYEKSEAQVAMDSQQRRRDDAEGLSVVDGFQTAMSGRRANYANRRPRD
jgi:hypothetical protein